MPPNNAWTRTSRKSGLSEVNEDLGKTEDVWTLRTDGFTGDHEEEADKEEQPEDDQGHEHEDEMTSTSGPMMGHP